jgi:hypothetical protein
VWYKTTGFAKPECAWADALASVCIAQNFMALAAIFRGAALAQKSQEAENRPTSWFAPRADAGACQNVEY